MALPECTAWNLLIFAEASSDAVARCLSQGADPNARDKYGVTPLHRAAWKSETPAVVNALLDAGADLSARDKKYGATPLHRAAWLSETPAVVQVLLDAGADLNARDKDGETPVHRAARWSKTPAVVQVLLDAGADPKARTKNGQTVFDLIGKNSHLRDTDVYWQLNDARFD